MSLVNYSSDEDDEEEAEQEGKEDGRPQQQQPGVAAFTLTEAASAHTSGRQVDFFSAAVETSLKLPDASQLFASLDPIKDSVTMTLSGGAYSSKKRSDLNGSANAPPKKIPKGSLMPVRIAPDIAGGSLLPPQLRGRSNIATEDLDKLFTRKSKKSIESGLQQD